MHLVVGLGNPGGRYVRTRHNVGFMAVDHLASRAGVAVEKKLFGALVADASLGGRKVLLTKPQSFMNLSGQPVASLMGFYKVPAADLIVLHDEMDIPLGRIKVQQGRGSGGHNGIRDVQRVAGNDYIRVRLGVGRPPAQWDPAEYVLSAFTAEEEQVVHTMLGVAAEAVACAVQDGVVAAMNRFNGDKPPARVTSGA